MQIRFEETTIGRFAPHWRKRSCDQWRAVFISAFDTIAEAKLWAKREFGCDVEFHD